MKETTITVEIHPIAPNRIKNDRPNYRIYINDELIIERTWIWNKLTYIDETLVVNLPVMTSNSIRVETIKANPAHVSQFILQNLHIDNTYKPLAENTSEISFILE